MKKILLSILVFIFITPVFAEELSINSKQAIMYNMNDNTIIYEKDSNKKVQIASLTKMMTTIVAIENINNLNDNVLMSKKAFEDLDDYSESGLKINDKVTYYDLLYATMLPSGADAAQQLALSVSGDINSFVNLMNKKAKELKLNNTKFSNVIGKDNINNYSTANDIANLLKYCLKNDIFKKVFTTKLYKINNLNLSFNSTLISYSKKYVIDTSYIKGSKTGFTEGAGVCLASIANINNIDYLLVVLGADYKDFFANHIKDSITLYNYYSSNYNYYNVVEKGDLIIKLPVKFSTTKNVDITFDKNISKYIKNDTNLDNVKIIYQGVNELTRKNYKNKLGIAKIMLNNQQIDQVNVYYRGNIKFYDIKLLAVIVCLLLIFILLTLKKVRRKVKYS